MLLPSLLALPQPFTRADAADVGISRHRIDRELRRGVLSRVHPGLYAVTEPWDSMAPWERHPGIALAAHRCHPDLTVSHVSAAALHGLALPLARLGRAVLTTRDTSTTTGHRWIELRHGDLPGHHVLEIGTARVTGVARTLVDCFRTLPLPDAVALTDHALRRRCCSGAEVLAARREQRRWPGVRAVDAGLPLVDPRRESWFESSSAVTLASWGMPLGVPQVDVLTTDGRWVARVDVAWPGTGVIGEADGRGKFLGDPRLGLGDDPHLVARRLLASHDRAEDLRTLGLQLIRWTPDEVRRTPLAVVHRWHAAEATSARQPHRALLRCHCCRRDPTECTFVRLPGVRIGGSSGQAGTKSGRGGGGGGDGLR